jgi:CheY-like chemotaxis protein
MAQFSPRTRPRVLVVDDDPGVLSVCITLLQLLGCDVQAANSGREALDMLLLRDEPADLVLLDLQMPGTRGDEVLRVLRRARPELRVVMMSGRPNVQLERFLAMGADAVLSKPFRLLELDGVLHVALDRPRAHKSLCADERGVLRVSAFSAARAASQSDTRSSAE